MIKKPAIRMKELSATPFHVPLGRATRAAVVAQLCDWNDEQRNHVGRVARMSKPRVTVKELMARYMWNDGEAPRYLRGFQAAVDDHQPTNAWVTGVAVRALNWVLETNVEWSSVSGRRPLTKGQRFRIMDRIAHLEATRPRERRLPKLTVTLDQLSDSLASGVPAHALYVHRDQMTDDPVGAVARKFGRSGHVADRLYQYIATRNFDRVYLPPAGRRSVDANREDEQWVKDVLACIFELMQAIAGADVRTGEGETYTVTLKLLDMLAIGIGYTIGEIPSDAVSQQRFAAALRSAKRVGRRRAA